MMRSNRRTILLRPSSALPLLLAIAGAPMGGRCGATSSPTAEDKSHSGIVVTVNPRGSVTLKTPVAEFEVQGSGYIRAFLLSGGKRLTLDEPEAASSSAGDYLLSVGQKIANFIIDFDHVRVTEEERIGSRGKKVEVTARTPGAGAPKLERTVTVEVFDDFPNLALTTVAYKNLGSTEIKLDQVVVQGHRLSASLADPHAPHHQLWSFQGSSYQWGQDDVIQISKDFSRTNVMGGMLPDGSGGGIPVVAFWTASMGEAIGHVETLPLVLSMPVRVGADRRVHASLVIEPHTRLKPGGVFSTPRTFVAVYAGDFYEPLRLWSSVLQRQGWEIPQPTNEDYNISWCSWGYQSDVTPAWVLGTIPKLKELNIKWATLDYRWFGHFGDWEARPETFPGTSIQKVVDELHKQGRLVQLWWYPLAAEDGQGHDHWGHSYQTAKVVKQHPDWLILDKDGKPAHIRMNLAALCPALPEVQDYYRKLTEKFIRDWGADGHKLDMCYTVPPCYNPQHHHKSPEESIYAEGEVFKSIFRTTRQLKPESVTQICPCGTPPNLAWLPYMDQAVTADPVGASQVRRRIKMYKALLGPQAAVYGDHVELSDMPRTASGGYLEIGRDFASTLGPGGVPGTKFTWPDYGPAFKNVLLTPKKAIHWKKWIDLYNSKMLSRGTFLNLYVYGYDIPEGYAIQKDGKVYYAFFAPDPARPWAGEIELRSLPPGKYRVFDYEHEKVLGMVDAQNPKLAVTFTQHLLVEASRE